MATYLGAWIVLLVLFIYGPILIAQMFDLPGQHVSDREGEWPLTRDAPQDR